MGLSPRFSRMSVPEKREYLLNNQFTRSSLPGNNDEDYLWICDVMVENAVGYAGLPLGITAPIRIDGQDYLVPMATEEASVIAAASYGGKMASLDGGFVTSPPQPLIKGHLYYANTTLSQAEKLMNAVTIAIDKASPMLSSMQKRGGGLESWDFFYLKNPDCHVIEITLNVCDSMGANLMNSYLEKLSDMLLELSGKKADIAILSNEASCRTGKAEFRISLDKIKRAGRYDMSAEEIGKKLVFLSEVAEHFPPRAVTHNKGIMNGITALALATGNDTRAIEASVHSYACSSGVYKGLATYKIEKDFLTGHIKAPVPFAAIGGSIAFTDYSRFSMDILGNPSSRQLASIALALGLAQNFAALLALSTRGIQAGHMKLHAKKIAYQAGARGRQIQTIADLLNKEKNYKQEFAEELLKTNGKDD
ncbi:MAG: hydroxymethylglutaryl-CoA reductase, degradative [Spirochaetales bacterium]|nr:hydroxymethylglutaryl-CoA reductase, degradative [Spirochaetales bacterium]